MSVVEVVVFGFAVFLGLLIVAVGATAPPTGDGAGGLLAVVGLRLFFVVDSWRRLRRAYTHRDRWMLLMGEAYLAGGLVAALLMAVRGIG